MGYRLASWSVQRSSENCWASFGRQACCLASSSLIPQIAAAIRPRSASSSARYALKPMVTAMHGSCSTWEPRSVGADEPAPTSTPSSAPLAHVPRSLISLPPLALGSPTQRGSTTSRTASSVTSTCSNVQEPAARRFSAVADASPLRRSPVLPGALSTSSEPPVAAQPPLSSTHCALRPSRRRRADNSAGFKARRGR
jgi:hypothetical protein